jgi:hypothetical protein
MLSSSHSKIHDPRVTGVSHDPRAADQCQEVRNTRHPVGCQNSAMLPDLRFQAAASYSFRSPPKIGRLRIRP